MAERREIEYLTNEHILPLKEKIDAHGARLSDHEIRFERHEGRFDNQDRRISAHEKTMNYVCETLTQTKSEVTTKQDGLAAQQNALSIKIDNIALSTQDGRIKQTELVKKIDEMAIKDAEEKGRRDAIAKLPMLIGLILIIMQIFNIVRKT